MNSRSSLSLIVAAATCGVLTVSVPGVSRAADPPAKTPPDPGVRGTDQTKGADGQFGQTYTLKSGFNYTIVSAEYSVARHVAGAHLVPVAGDKLVILHVRVKNSGKEEAYFDRSAHMFTLVDSADENHDGGDDYGRAGVGMSTQMKPGQGYDDLYTAIKMPAKGAPKKLMFLQGRLHTADDVMRFNIGVGKNVIAPLPAWVRDPADPTGATALTEAPAKMAVFYPLTEADMRVDSISFSDSPLAGDAPDEGKRWLIANVTLVNKIPDELSVYDGTFTTTLKDADNEDYPMKTVYKPSTDEGPNKSIKLNEEYHVRIIYVVPKAAKMKTLRLGEGDSRTLLYDLTDVK